MAQRDRWTGRTAFLLASFGTAIGLGNVWRFPMMAYENGGGAFLIPYIVALLTAGIPLMIVEFALGQRFQKASPGALREVHPRFEIVGWWGLGAGAVISFYYTVLMAWSFDFLAASLHLPWSADPQGYFDRLLRLTDGPANIGGFSWPVVVGLALSWAWIYWSVNRGVQKVGKIVYVTVPLPVVLTALILVRGLTLPGSFEGLKYYLTPDYRALLSAKTWLAAYSQVFFSLSLGFGILTAYASYRPKRSDVTNNAFLTSLADSGYAYLAGFAVFSVLGYLAMAQSAPVAEVARGGPSLAFVIYPKAISLMPLAPVVAVAFFITLLTLAIDSAFSIVEGVVAALRDKWGVSQAKASAWFCIVGFLAGLIFTTGSGIYWLDIVDHWTNNYGLVVVGLLECVAIGWFYGTRKFKEYINEVSDFRLGWWWDIVVRWVTPLVLGWALVTTIVEEVKAPYGGYPTWTLVAGGWAVVAAIVLVAALVTRSRPRTGKEAH